MRSAQESGRMRPDEPRMEIVDAHHHLWDLSANYYPWLTDHIAERVGGDYSPIRKDYPIADFLRDISSQNVVKSVHVQAEHDPRDPVRETRWLQEIADDVVISRGFPHAIVAYADFPANDVCAMLEAHAHHDNLRGIRQSLNGVINDRAHNRSLINNPVWRRNLRLLERFGLSFDLQLYPEQMNEMAQVVAENEGTQFILCHAGMPADGSATGIARWRAGMHRLARLPNVAVKISGLGMFDRSWTVASIRSIVLATIDIFGTDRSMFASNFPVDGMMASYDRIWNAFKTLTSDFSEPERNKLFKENAIHYYRL